MAASTCTTTSLTSTTSDEQSEFWWRGTSYPTYQEKVAAKRGANKDKLESLGLGDEDMASMRREAAADLKRSKAKKKNKSKSNHKREEVGVTSREYPLRNRTTTPVRLSREAVAELVQKSEEVSVCLIVHMIAHMISTHDVHLNPILSYSPFFFISIIRFRIKRKPRRRW